jgi:phosphatidylethanolamine N-methyltransferase
MSAHRTLGHYAWFWGDFFFRIKTSLTFDGIFELFPHPM